MRVLLVHNFYQQHGGEDAIVRAEQDSLRSRGVEVRLYSRHNDELQEYGLRDKLLFPLHALTSPRTERDLPAVLREFQPHVAWLHNLYPLISPAVYRTLDEAGIPMVQTLHNYRPFCANGLLMTKGAVCDRCLGGRPWNGVVHKCFRDSYALSLVYAVATHKAQSLLDRVQLFLCPSEFVRRKFLEAGLPEAKLRVRPNSIDTSDVAPSDRPGQYALSLGRLSPEKGIATLLAAFRDTPEIPLIVAGTGPAETSLREYAAAHRMDHVKFVGFQSGDAKWALLDNAEFLIVSSECLEAFPTTILEAFAKARPVLGSRAGGTPQIVEEGRTGLLFEPGSSNELAAQARFLHANPFIRSRMGNAARRAVERHYDANVSVRQLIDIFREIAPAPIEAAASC